MSVLLRLFCVVGSVLAMVMLAAQAHSATPGEILRRQLEAGDSAAAIRELQPQAHNSAEARMALGFAQFHKALNGLAAGLYRHGFRTPENPFLPVFRLPVPLNPAPEPVDYAKLRAVYQGVLDDLAVANATLKAVPVNEGKLVLDINAISVTYGQLNGRAVSTSIGGLIGALARRPAGHVEVWEVAFDRSDALWLASYSHLLSATLEFVMAHDWGPTFDATAHLFFAGAKQAPGLDRSRAVGPAQAPNLMRSYEGILDQIAVLHLVHWPAGDKVRMRAVLGHLKGAVATSREMWTSILAETDDDREWLPSPRQKSRAVPGLPITDDMVKGWLVLLDEMDGVLDGRLLIGHWRFKQGIDLKAVFEDPRPFDLVLWTTGHGAIPYLRDGPVLDGSVWQRWNRTFGNNFLGYAVFIN